MTEKPSKGQLARAKMGRTVSLVIAGSMLFWFVAPMIGRELGLHGNYAILIDLFVLAALFWALVISVGLWRKRNDP